MNLESLIVTLENADITPPSAGLVAVEDPIWTSSISELTALFAINVEFKISKVFAELIAPP